MTANNKKMKGLQVVNTIRVLMLTLALVGFLMACQPDLLVNQESEIKVSDRTHSYTWDSTGFPFPGTSQTLSSCGMSCGGEVPSGCSVVTVSKGDRVFFAGNDNYILPDTYFWVEPGQGDNYGVVWIGKPDDVQQGVNEMGLAYDANGLPKVEMNPHLERIPWADGITSPQIQILHECATVEEVIEWVQTHQVNSSINDQKQFADASGDAVLISPGLDGELIFTRKPPGDGFLVSTNFNVTNPSHNFSYPCWRYETAQNILSQLVEGNSELTAQDARNVLDAVHVEDSTLWTIVSLVSDLPNGLIYLYFFYQYDQPVVLNVANELAHPRAPGPLSKLFPDDVQQEAARRYKRIQEGVNRCRRAGMIWIVTVFSCIVLLIALLLGKRQDHREPVAMLLWLLLIIVLGPLGFCTWLIVRRRPNLDGWRGHLLEVVSDVMPIVVAFSIFLLLAFSLPSVENNSLALLGLVIGLPVGVSGLVFQAPLLAMATKKAYLKMLWKRLPHTLVTANLGMTGIYIVATLLINVIKNTCAIFPSPGWSTGTLWAIIVLGALLGSLLIYIYQLWSANRGLSAWCILIAGDGEVRTGSLRMLWWWVLLSYVVLVCGLISSIVLQQLFSA